MMILLETHNNYTKQIIPDDTVRNTTGIRPCVQEVSTIGSRKVFGQVTHPDNHTCHFLLHTPRPVDSNDAYPTGRPTGSAPDTSAPESKSGKRDSGNCTPGYDYRDDTQTSVGGYFCVPGMKVSHVINN